MNSALSKEDRPGVIETLGAALSRGNLTQREGPCGLDKVMALGMVGMEEKIADTVIRLKYGNDPKMYTEANKVILDLARRLNNADNWMMGSKLESIAKAVLDYWLVDICPVCVGRRARKVIGTPFLDEEACGACQGSGKRPYPWLSRRPRDKSEKCHTALLIAIEEAERRIRDRLVSKLATQIRGMA